MTHHTTTPRGAYPKNKKGVGVKFKNDPGFPGYAIFPVQLLKWHFSMLLKIHELPSIL
tara:strand:- start:133 stop:306 length:174 start_codon:yes stop_codon:yes gene_type:complete